MRIEYAGSVHDEEEIQAVVEVLRGAPEALHERLERMEARLRLAASKNTKM